MAVSDCLDEERVLHWEENGVGTACLLAASKSGRFRCPFRVLSVRLANIFICAFVTTPKTTFSLGKLEKNVKNKNNSINPLGQPQMYSFCNQMLSFGTLAQLAKEKQNKKLGTKFLKELKWNCGPTEGGDKSLIASRRDSIGNPCVKYMPTGSAVPTVPPPVRR